MRKTRGGFFSGIFILCILIVACAYTGFAVAEKNYLVIGENYVLPDNSDYVLSEGEKVDNFFYGARSLGSLCVTGEIDKATTYNGFTAYGTSGQVTIRYEYKGSYQHVDEDRWYVDNDGTGKVNSYGLGAFLGVGHGCIIVEKSDDGVNWEKIKGPILNYFTGEKNQDESTIYSIPEYEIVNGCYYRVLVAYRFCRRSNHGFVWFLGESHEYKKCIELYSFYICSDKNHITITDLGSGGQLEDQTSTATGFQIHRNGSQAIVKIEGKEDDCQDYSCYTDPGEYIVNIKTNLGNEYSKKITVTDGLNFVSLQKRIYESDRNKGFPLNKPMTGTVYGKAMTSLFLAVPKGSGLKQDGNRYGIRGKSISLYLRLIGGNVINGWGLESDKWGERNQELVCGVGTGTVGKGALIIRTSTDGKHWTDVDKGRYAEGLYTTDYASHYHEEESVLIYTPDGKDVINGVYIRVLYAYQVKKTTANEYRDYVESYEFYLCNDDVDVVTFHNLSAEETLKEEFKDEDQNAIEVYKKAETLTDGSCTTSGFVVDKSLNSTVMCKISCNGVAIDSSKDKYDEPGKYDILLTSAVGSTKELTIYVDRMTPEESAERYFGEGFISGKRIYSEGDCPIFEAEKTRWHVKNVDTNVLPLYGQITNLTTGSVITVEQSPEEKGGMISEPGEYQAVFSTNKSLFANELTGDARVFRFRFLVIAKDTAPGPVINKRSLEEYSHSTVVDSNPVYYGITYSSAEKGKITLAFASKEEAASYAYEYEKGLVEKQENGGYRYSGSLVVDQNIKYDSTWDLTDAVNYFAEAAVHKHFFNMSDEFTYLSIKDDDLEKYPNLRQLELPRSVTIFGEDQKRKLTDIEALPLLNDKPYAYLNPETGEEERGFYSFQFLTDQYGGIDSKSVVIIDSEGKQHNIAYNESVGQQLLQDHCPSGIVKIREETMYGDVTEYQAMYIAQGDNRTELTLEYTNNGKNKSEIINGNKAGIDIIADAFRINGLTDPIDPYAYVIVKHIKSEEAYTAKDTIDKTWSKPGPYSIICLNRMGYGYAFTVTIPGALDSESDDFSTQPDKLDASGAMSGNKKNDNNGIVVIAIIFGLILIATVGVLACKRLKMFARTAENMRNEGDKNE